MLHFAQPRTLSYTCRSGHSGELKADNNVDILEGIRLLKRHAFVINAGSTPAKSRATGKTARKYTSRVILLSAAIKPLFTQMVASNEEKAMCHIDSEIGNGKL